MPPAPGLEVLGIPQAHSDSRIRTRWSKVCSASVAPAAGGAQPARPLRLPQGPPAQVEQLVGGGERGELRAGRVEVAHVGAVDELDRPDPARLEGAHREAVLVAVQVEGRGRLGHPPVGVGRGRGRGRRARRGGAAPRCAAGRRGGPTSPDRRRGRGRRRRPARPGSPRGWGSGRRRTRSRRGPGRAAAGRRGGRRPAAGGSRRARGRAGSRRRAASRSRPGPPGAGSSRS